VIDGGSYTFTKKALEVLATAVGASMIGENEGVDIGDVEDSMLGKNKSMYL